MKKSSLVIFGLFAVVFLLVIPFWAIEKQGGADASPENVASSEAEAKVLFQTNCGTCHTLAKAGTHGVVGPNLDEILGTATPDANYTRVLSALQNGVGGRMPAGILSGEQAKQVAHFVADEAGQ